MSKTVYHRHDHYYHKGGGGSGGRPVKSSDVCVSVCYILGFWIGFVNGWDSEKFFLISLFTGFFKGIVGAIIGLIVGIIIGSIIDN